MYNYTYPCPAEGEEGPGGQTGWGICSHVQGCLVVASYLEALQTANPQVAFIGEFTSMNQAVHTRQVRSFCRKEVTLFLMKLSNDALPHSSHPLHHGLFHSTALSFTHCLQQVVERVEGQQSCMPVVYGNQFLCTRYKFSLSEELYKKYNTEFTTFR